MQRHFLGLQLLAAALLVLFPTHGDAQSLADLAGGYKLSLPLGSSTTLFGICIPEQLGGELLLAAETTSSVDGNSALYTRAKTSNITFASRSYVAIESAGCSISGNTAGESITSRPCAQEGIPDPSCFYIRDTGSGIIAFGALEPRKNGTCPSSDGLFAFNFAADGTVCARLASAATRSLPSLGLATAVLWTVAMFLQLS